MEIKAKLKETNDTITLEFDVSQLENMPLKVAMKTLELMENNNKLEGMYFQFDAQTQKFIDNNKEKYIEELNKEEKSFKKLSEVYFNSLKGPLYAYSDKVYEYISNIYEKEQYFVNIKEQDIPKIVYKFEFEQDSNYEKSLQVKNLKELIEKFGGAETLHSMVLFVDSLNYAYQKENKFKTSKKPFGLSKSILRETFDSEKNEHPRLESFNGKDYFLESFFNGEVKKLEKPEQIFALVLMREELRKQTNQINVNKLKIK